MATSLVSCGGSSPSFCEQAEEFQRADFTGGDLEADISDALDTMDDLIEAAPAEVVTDLVAVRDGVEDFVRGGRPDADLAAASGRVSAYLAQECDAPGETRP